jgi:hypothetical protein
MAIADAQLVHSTYRENRNNRTNRMSEVHGGDTAARMQLAHSDEEPSLSSTSSTGCTRLTTSSPRRASNWGGDRP